MFDITVPGYVILIFLCLVFSLVMFSLSAVYRIGWRAGWCDGMIAHGASYNPETCRFMLQRRTGDKTTGQP
jgi:hypothetical protein